MNWRGGVVVPGDYGEAEEKLPIIGGGSTRQTKYYQQTWKRGEELKEFRSFFNLNDAEIYNINDTSGAAWPPQDRKLLNVAQGTADYQRSGKEIWGLRLQVKVSVTWAEWSDNTVVGLNTRPTKQKLLVALIRFKHSDAVGSGPKWPAAGELFDQNWQSNMPVSYKNPKAEILAWGNLTPDDYFYSEATTNIEVEGIPTADWRQTRKWAQHTTYLDFDISLRGSKFKYPTATAAPPVQNDINLAVWIAEQGDIKMLGFASGDAVNGRYVFSWSQKPPKRLWNADSGVFQRAQRGRDWYDQDRPDMRKKAREILWEEGAIPELIEALEEDMAMEPAYKRAHVDYSAEAMEPAGKKQAL